MASRTKSSIPPPRLDFILSNCMVHSSRITHGIDTPGVKQSRTQMIYRKTYLDALHIRGNADFGWTSSFRKIQSMERRIQKGGIPLVLLKNYHGRIRIDVVTLDIGTYFPTFLPFGRFVRMAAVNLFSLSFRLGKTVATNKRKCG